LVVTISSFLPVINPEQSLRSVVVRRLLDHLSPSTWADPPAVVSVGVSVVLVILCYCVVVIAVVDAYSCRLSTTQALRAMQTPLHRLQG
jgi:hypothetical protein